MMAESFFSGGSHGSHHARDFAKTAGITTATALAAAPSDGCGMTAFASASSGWAIAAIRCCPRFSNTKIAEVAAVCDIYQPYVDFAVKNRREPDAVQELSGTHYTKKKISTRS